MENSSSFIDLAGLCIGVVIGGATVFIAWMQTKIAKRQNEISQALQALEESRDRPHLVVRSVATVSEHDCSTFRGEPETITVAFELLNVGGGAAWNIALEVMRVFAVSCYPEDGPPAASGDPTAVVWENGADVCFDLQAGLKVGLLQPGEAGAVSVTFQTDRQIEEVIDVEVFRATRESRDGSASWNTTPLCSLSPPSSHALERQSEHLDSLVEDGHYMDEALTGLTPFDEVDAAAES